jgi:hypothetical protein
LITRNKISNGKNFPLINYLNQNETAEIEDLQRINRTHKIKTSNVNDKKMNSMDGK